MKTTIQYVEDLKRHFGVGSTYALAKSMGLGDQTVRGWTKGHTFSDKHAVMIEQILDLSPGEVLASVAAERTKCPEARAIWEMVSSVMHSHAAGIMVAFVAISLYAAPSEPGYSAANSSHSAPSLSIMLSSLEQQPSTLFAAVILLISLGFMLHTKAMIQRNQG
jgi:hypothetical protein